MEGTSTKEPCRYCDDLKMLGSIDPTCDECKWLNKVSIRELARKHGFDERTKEEKRRSFELKFKH